MCVSCWPIYKFRPGFGFSKTDTNFTNARSFRLWGKEHNASTMSLSYEDWQLEDSDMLCWEDRLLHMTSKVRYAGNVDLIFLCDSITDPKDRSSYP